MKKNIQTKQSFLKKVLDKLWTNKKFHKYSESQIDQDKNYITSPVDWTVAYSWKLWENWEFISKWWKTANLSELMWDKAKDFANFNYLNIYLSPKNRHFFCLPYDSKIINTFANNWKAICPIFIWIENFFNIEVFHKAITKNATLSSILETNFWKMWFIAVWSLNVNHIEFNYMAWENAKKWDYFGHFNLWSSVILIFPENFDILKKTWEKLVIWEKIVKIKN